MQIILAIVADHQQASQLATLIKSRLSVDLIQAAEAGEALLALDNRIPDLVLTSPWMSPFDDGVLDEYLRGLGPAGAHVQTLRIPVLKQAPKKTARLGFSLRRKAKPEPALEGCDPKVFADEIAQYLVRAAEDKQHASSNPPVPVAQEQEPAANDEWTAESGTWRSDLLDRQPADESGAAASAHDPERDAVSYEQYTGNADARDVEPAGPVTEYAVPYEPYVEKHQEAEPVAPAVEYVEPAAVEYVAPAAVEYVEPAAAEYVAPAAAEYVAPAAAKYVEPAAAEYVAPAAAEYVAPAAAKYVEPAAAEYIVSGPEPAPATPAEPIPAKPREAVTARAPKPVQNIAVAKADTTIDEAGEAESHKTPSFKAALAAIRAAWGKQAPANAGAPDQKGSAPPPAAKPAEPVTATPVVPSPQTASMPAAPVVPAAPVPEPSPSADSRKTLEAGVNGSEEAEEVYEISVEPDMSELESTLMTPLKAPAKREAMPARPEASSSEVGAPIEDRRPPGAPAGKRKKGKRSFAPAKARPPRQDPPAQVQPAPGEPVQDEWGIFDPNQCGFAALVDRLDEVSDDEKPETPPRKGTKVRVISYS